MKWWWLLCWTRLSFISDIFGPSIFWSSPSTITLYSKIVNTSDQSEIATLTPITSPRIPNYPIFLPIFFSPSSYTNLMIIKQSTSCISKDSSSIVYKCFSNCNRTRNRSSLINLIHNGSLTLDHSELIDTIYLRSLLCPASRSRHTIFALDFWWASDTISSSERSIGWASLISYVIIKDPLVSVKSITSITAVVLIITWYQNLRREVDVWPLSFTSNFDTVRKCWGYWESPAWSTINWDVLISLNCEVVCAIDGTPPIWFWKAFSRKLF